MRRIDGAAPPTRRAAYAISMGHYQRSLVLVLTDLGRTAEQQPDQARLPLGRGLGEDAFDMGADGMLADR